MTIQADRIAQICEDHRRLEGPLLPILHAVQAEFGCVDGEAERAIAQSLNLSRAEVHGVVSFYTDFRTTPPGRTRVLVCRAEACQSVGARELADHARERLGIPFGATTADEAVTLEQVFCLGNCALGPAVQVDGRLHGRVDAARFDALIAEAAR